MSVDLVVHGAGALLTCAGGDPGPACGARLADLGIVPDGALVAAGGRIEWVGPSRELARALDGREAARTIDASGCVVMPAFVDPHTHVPFAGGREAEFRMRIEGRGYLEIARAGGGILSSVDAFRRASTDALVALNRRRLEQMLEVGSVTIECKSGYGLSTSEELRALEIVRALESEGPWRLVPTFLGAHALPRGYGADRGRYVSLVIEEMIPAVVEQGIARYCDVFIEEGAFTLEEGRRILEAARDRGLGLKLHVDEFHALGGSRLAAELGAVSADHLEAIEEPEIEALARGGVIGVLMPGVNHFLANGAAAPARRLIEAGVPIALATDFNPGSCMCHAMEMILSLACLSLRLTPEEAIVAATRNAAYAVGAGDRTGRLEAGLDADLLVMDVADHRTIPYHFGTTHVSAVVAGGVVVHTRG